MKLFTATLGTETNTFSALPTGLQNFRETCLFRGGDYGDPPPLLESYTYPNLKLNPGLTNADFDPKNPAYNFGIK